MLMKPQLEIQNKALLELNLEDYDLSHVLRFEVKNSDTSSVSFVRISLKYFNISGSFVTAQLPEHALRIKGCS